MTPLLALLLSPLAVWRIAKMITEEEGPFSVFTWVRHKVTQKTWVGRGLVCLWCVSFWVGLVVGVWASWPNIEIGLFVGLCNSALAILYDVIILRLTSAKR